MGWRDVLGGLGGAYGGPLGGFAGGAIGGAIDNRSRGGTRIGTGGNVSSSRGPRLRGSSAGGASRGFDWGGAANAVADHVALRNSRPPPIPGGIDPAQAGVNTRAYNDAAYPGTTPWEQLGGGSNANAMETEQRGNELRQRERESIRSAQVQAHTNQASIQASRQSAAASISRDLLGNFGAAGLSKADHLINSTGILGDTTSGFGSSPLMQARGMVRSRMDYNRSTARSQASQAGSAASQARSSALNTGGYISKEVKSGYGIVKDVVGTYSKYKSQNDAKRQAPYRAIGKKIRKWWNK